MLFAERGGGSGNVGKALRISPTVQDVKFLNFPNSTLAGNLAMEEDRAATNLGKAEDTEASAEHEAVPRVPKKRFIGRRAAAEKTGTAGEPHVTAEDSSAIQGILLLDELLVH